MFRTEIFMPQLDALTYFSQFVYLLITFVGCYVFVLVTIIPKVVGLLKLRQKLNTIAQVTSKLTTHCKPIGDEGALISAHQELNTSNWYARGTSGFSKTWPQCAAMLQIGQTLRLKKLFCTAILKPYKGSL